MTFLSPTALLWLLGIPVLVWLWRLASTQRRTTVSSLAPFEHLLARAPRRRSRVTVNALFWLQLAGLAAVALALARPVIHTRSAATVLAILDTSASMDARHGVSRAFDRAQGALRARLGRKSPATHVLVVTTAPPAAAATEPQSDGLALNAAVGTQRTVPQGGRLATAARLGRALLGRAPDETWVATDELKPEDLPADVQWLGVGRPAANNAITGVDAAGALCQSAGSRVVVSVQRFADSPARSVVTARQHGRELARAEVELTPGVRQSVSLDLPADTSGWLEVSLSNGGSLAVDDRAWVELRQGARRPIHARITRPALRHTVTGWLAACPALTWSESGKPSVGAILLTDDAEQAASASAPTLLFVEPNAPSAPAHWTAEADHPLGAYLSPITVVSAPLAREEGAVAGTPVVSALLGGRAVPVLVADERAGRRVVTLRADPSGLADSVPLVIMFFNTVRWLMDESGPKTTQDGLTAGGWEPGQVTVHRPDGSRASVASAAGVVQLEDAAPGLYRLSQGNREITAAVNFFDPVESNTFAPPSTWQQASEPAAAETRTAPAAPPGLGRRPTHQLASMLMMGLLVLLVAEWLLYGRRRTAR